ncbi:plant cysteine oxidase 2 [Malania oleifera]|uniref:plant cysteine oxidase 2 n=1 Tax=Malania oleifera TaxID=397392 RepID=UPI0025AE756B|nr:plant cysteine oxidase 2 [Malania oleifera]
MGIERFLADRKGNEFCELPKVTNSKSKKNRRRPKKPPLPLSPVQRLFETCKQVFSFGGTGTVPPSNYVEQLRSVLDSLKPVDVGLTPDMPYFRATPPGRTPAITYLHVFECDSFSIGIFCLPPGGVIPLHNHPGMTVFSKLLLGSMHIKAYDWASDMLCNTATNANGEVPHVRLATVKVDSDFTAPCGTSILYPATGGNMHCFTALTACAVLDVLGPPYSDPDGRHCTYYLDYPFARLPVDGVAVPEEERESYAWLKEREKPKDLTVVGAKYRGPKIVD